MDHNLAINQVIQNSAKYNKLLYLALIDYEKALDPVEIAAVMKALRDQGLEQAYIKLLEDI